MLVPAMAFSWWLASLPLQPHASAASHLVRDGRVGSVGASAIPTERVVPGDESAVSPARARGAIAVAAAPDATDPPSDYSDGDDSPPAEPAHERVPYRGPVTPELARAARSFLDLPMGSERVAEVAGRTFVFVLEPHYHPPGFVGAPNGWHKGVTVYETR